MRIEPKWAKRRAEHRGLHGPRKINNQRRTALLLVNTGMVRVIGWSALAICYILKVPFAVEAFKSVAFVALISDIALIETAFSQVAASLAQLSAADSHHDAESTRSALAIDFLALESDIARLAKLQPGPESDRLVMKIRRQLKH